MNSSLYPEIDLTLQVTIPLLDVVAEDAVGIEEEDAAVGREGSLDDRRVGAHHAVEQDGTSRGLLEPDRMPGADGEAVPADRGPVRGLTHGHDLAGRGDRGRSRHDVRSIGQRPGQGDPGDPEGVQESEESPTGGGGAVRRASFQGHPSFLPNRENFTPV